MTKIHFNNEAIRELYRAKEFETSYLSWFSSMFCRDYVGAYIMTLGVVDECRGMGLGSRLLN